MRFYYIRGLFIIFSLSILFACAIPASLHRNTSYDGNNSEDYEDYYDEIDTESNNNITVDRATSEARPTTTTTSVTSTVKTTKKSKYLFSKPSYFFPRSNRVIELNCPKACLCLEDFKHILCNGAGLTEVPKNLPTTTLIIDLSENNITQLHKEDFANITKVREINLNGNRLNIINKEVFDGLKHLQRLRLTDNKITYLESDTFSGINDLNELDLSNNSILLKGDGPFLTQPVLRKFVCRNCSWTQLYDNTFIGVAGLTSLNLDLNGFNKKINVKAFMPLQNIIKLRLPELEPPEVTELCNILKTIDNINFRHFDVSCFELVLGTSFNESVTLVTDPPYIPPKIAIVPTKVPESAPKVVTNKENQKKSKPTKPIATKPTTQAIVDKQKEIKKEAKQSKMSEAPDFSNFTISTTISWVNSTSMQTVVFGGLLGGSNDTANNIAEITTIKSIVQDDNSHQVKISPETVNLLLICIIIIAVVGIIIGIICRRDVGGIKTKCCRTKKNEPKDEVHHTEEIPLNKLAN